MTTITLELPDKTIAQAREAAQALHKPVETLLSDMLAAVMPDMQATPSEMQAELTAMTWLDNQSLWAIAQNLLSEQQQNRLETLTQLQAQRALLAEETVELEKLRREYGRITLRKARAYTLLSLRAGKPLLANL